MSQQARQQSLISLFVMLMNDPRTGSLYNPILRCRKSVSWSSQLFHKLMLLFTQCNVFSVVSFCL